MAIEPTPPAPSMEELTKDIPGPETPMQMGSAPVARGEVVHPLPTPGTSEGGVADAGQTLSGAGVGQTAEQNVALHPDVRALYDRLWGPSNQGSAQPVPAPAEETPAPAEGPDLSPDV